MKKKKHLNPEKFTYEYTQKILPCVWITMGKNFTKPEKRNFVQQPIFDVGLFTHLSEDLMNEILYHMTPSSVVALMKVNRRFFYICSDRSVRIFKGFRTEKYCSCGSTLFERLSIVNQQIPTHLTPHLNTPI